MFTSIKRVIKFGWEGFCRNKTLSFATIFIIIIAILLITSLFLFQGMSQFFISYLQEKIDISTSFKFDINEINILEVKDELLKMPEVKSVEYVSKEEALKNFKERHKNDEVIMRSLEEAKIVRPFPFPAVLNIEAQQPDQYGQIVKFLENERFKNIIYSIDYYDRRPIIENIFIITRWINQTILIIFLIFVLIAILITFNTIKLTILNQKEELIIKRLVGASNWFISGPFLVQGMISGFFAALISFLISLSVVYFWGHNIGILLPGFDTFSYFLDRIFFIFFVQVAIGIILGLISNGIAIKKYLKV